MLSDEHSLTYYSELITQHLLLTMNNWPILKFAEWKDTLATLHMWTQVVGKIRLELTPLVNHWWNVPLYVSPRGLTTSSMPYGDRAIEIEFDFIEHKLRIDCSDGANKILDLRPQSVADFYAEVMNALRELSVTVEIWTMPVEVPNPIRFTEDNEHKSYDPEYAFDPTNFDLALLATTILLRDRRENQIWKFGNA